MPTNLTNTKIKDTFVQLLHVDGGPEATPKAVHSAAGTLTALRLGTAGVEVGDVRISANVIGTVGADVDLELAPNGTGSVIVPKVAFSDAAQARGALELGTLATQDSDDVVITGGSITDVSFTGSFTGITLIESQAFHTVNGGDGLEIENTRIVADGTSTDIDIDITPKGTGEVNIPKVDIDGGAIDGTPIGSSTASTIRGTTVQATTSIGYPAGTGGAETQLTSKSTAVTLDKISGRITMHNATLNRNTGVNFTLNNSFIAATDVVILNIVSGATLGVYTATVDAVVAGSCSIHLHNHTTGSDLGEAVVLSFVVIKGAHS
jgi:hypothetical protein